MKFAAYLLATGQSSICEAADDDAAKAAAEKEAADKAAADEAAKGKGKTYTQDELNNIVKNERKKYEDQIKAQIATNDQLAKSKNLTDAERQRLSEHNEQLKNELLSKEELAAKERQRMAESHSTEVKTLAVERDSWRERYNTAEISRGIADATLLHEAVSVEQMSAVLRPWTSMIEEVDGSGQGTGTHIPKVKFPTKDKDNKPITLELSISDAVKLMKETPERFSNLFKSGLKSGLGMDGGTGKRTVQDIKTMSPAAYAEMRRKEEGKR